MRVASLALGEGLVLAFRIGSSNREHLVVSPSRRELIEASDDANWVHASIRVAAGGFRGEYDAMLRAEDFVRFRDELRPLQDGVSGRAAFDTTEDGLRVDVLGDGRGQFDATCIATDPPEIGNRLSFRIRFGEDDLRTLLADLDAICTAIPVVGKRRGD
jgi:hypothetical protein